jgi:hypothetical protein
MITHLLGPYAHRGGINFRLALRPPSGPRSARPQAVDRRRWRPAGSFLPPPCRVHHPAPGQARQCMPGRGGQEPAFGGEVNLLARAGLKGVASPAATSRLIEAHLPPELTGIEQRSEHSFAVDCHGASEAVSCWFTVVSSMALLCAHVVGPQPLMFQACTQCSGPALNFQARTQLQYQLLNPFGWWQNGWSIHLF